MGNMKVRSEIDPKYTWDLKHIFESDEAWEKSFAALEEKAKEIIKYKGRLSESPEVMAEALDFYQESAIEAMELYPYARMNKDLDNKDPKYQAMFDRVVAFYFQMSGMAAFIDPEISAMDEKILEDWISNESSLSDYSHYLRNLIRHKAHILSETEEKLLTGIGPTVQGIGESFTMLNNVELDFGEVDMPDGSKVKVTHGSYGFLREHPDREVRSQTFDKLHTGFKNFGNTIATIYSTSVKSDVFFARTRKHESCMSSAMFADNLSVEIYTKLIEAVHESLPSYYKYLKLRKEVMGLDDLHIYDTAIPIVEQTDSEYSYDQAKEILREGLEPLGQDYLDDLFSLVDNRAVDVYETDGKTSGAYAWGTYKSHPYMLLNWSGKLDDVFTFAHEAGHVMHSYYAGKNQTFLNSHYPIYLAEIASTVNENVLLRHMLEKCDTTTKEGLKEKAFLINHYLDGVKGTVLRQTMFAEFELKVHEMAEQGQPLNASILSDLYGGLLELYFGPDVVIDEYMRWEWARIPHFYSAFYVYKYATGFCAAAMISNQIFEDEGAVEKYKQFLSAGGSDYPSNILGIMGIDMTEPHAVDATMKLFDERVDELAEILKQLEESK